MPPSNQGSKSTLVVWVVLTSVLFFTALGVALFQYTNAAKAQEDLALLEERYREIIPDPNAPVVGELRTVRSNREDISANTPLLQVAVQLRDEAKQMIGGPNEDLAALQASFAAAQTRVSNVAGTGAQTGTLLAMVESLAGRAGNLQTEVATAKRTAEQEAQRLQRSIEEGKGREAALSAARDAAVSAQEAAELALNAARDATSSEVESLSSQVSVLAREKQEAQVGQSDRIQELETANAALQASVRQLQAELARNRLPVDAIANQVDGRVLRVSGQNVVFIDLGRGDQISPGITFEVFDRNRPIPNPARGGGNASDFRGKASIEVVRVQPGSAEARIIRQDDADPIREGDALVNLVFDKNTRNIFVVYGDFDLDQDGNPSAADNDVVRDLVRQWGGAVSDSVSVETDFLVLGQEPVVPEYSQQELQNPLTRARYDFAVQELQRYNQVRERAEALSVPILNQDRFLYFVGYFEQAQR
ncbi:MAG: hypothetical protein ACFCVE_01810 [Phycisphaerae bacterium]